MIDTYIERFQQRVVQDAILEATAAHWHRRAAAFEAALRLPGDFMGRTGTQASEARQRRLKSVVSACRSHAELLRGGPHE